MAQTKKVQIRATCEQMGTTPIEHRPVHVFRLWVNDKKVCDNSSFTQDRYTQLYHIYENNAMIASMTLEALGIENEVDIEYVDKN